jgi:hypothetical protein
MGRPVRSQVSFGSDSLWTPTTAALVGRRLLTHELVGDRLTPCLLKHQSIYKQREVVYLDPANSIGSRIGRGNLTPSRAKLRESFTVLLLIFSCPHIAIRASNVVEL